jgi:Meiotically Up-regulated Gene 113 (MUG113) protein
VIYFARQYDRGLDDARYPKGTPCLVKIGLAADVRRVKQRRTELRIGNPLPMLIVAVTDGEKADEKFLHNKLHAQRVRGEWFSLVVDPFVGRLADATDAYVSRGDDVIVRDGHFIDSVLKSVGLLGRQATYWDRASTVAQRQRWYEAQRVSRSFARYVA